jgi:putative membrane protein
LATGLESKLAPGATTVAEGNEDLATGLGAAAEKTPQLAEGLGSAADGAPQIVDGTKQLSEQGTQKLIEAGNNTAMDFGERFAIIEAAAETTKDGGLPYGAPEQSDLASAAYTMDLAGEGSPSGSDATKGIVALVLIGGAAAGGAALSARR